jgi:shikimate kinase
MRRPIVITGFMGSGKSKVARELSRHLNLTMIDLDDAITAREGKSPAQLIVEHGEPYFRTIESEVLCDLLQAGGAGIIALGGGAWIEETNRKMIDEHGCVTVWMDTPFEVCWARIETSAEDRPLGKTRDQALALFERRQPVYRLASIHIQNLEDLISATDLHG